LAKEIRADYLPYTLHPILINYPEFATSCYMKTNIFDRIQAISYSCHMLLPFILLKTKYVEFRNENKKLTMHLPQTPITKYIKLLVILENSKIFKIYAQKKIHICSHMTVFI